VDFGGVYEEASVELFEVEMRDVEDQADPVKAFAERTERGFLEAATWLRQCKVAGLQRWREQGKKAEIWVQGILADREFDLQIPPEFLLECGRLGLRVIICTYLISASAAHLIRRGS
jgi:hypothetical protein